MRSMIVLLAALLFFQCSGSRHAGQTDQKDLQALLKRLQKRGDDGEVLADIKRVYSEAYFKAHVRLQNYYAESAPGKWERVIPELQSLQTMHDAIAKSAYAYKNIQPANYFTRLIGARDSAASDYYTYAESLGSGVSRDQNHLAYNSYSRALYFVPDYRDARARMTQLYESSIIQVLINPVEYDVLGWGFNSVPFYNSQMFDVQTRLIQDLGAQSARSIPARFYTPQQMRQYGISPDLVTDMVWRNVQMDNPATRTRSYNRSKQIETGRDTANRPVYKTVNATVFVNEEVLEAQGTLHLLVNDVVRRQQVAWEQFPSDYRYTYEYATYTGDRRALGENDWTLINRSRNPQLPTRGEVFAAMLDRIYQRVQSRIRQAANW